MINLNDSDSNDLISVSVIASFYAKQIINYRSKFGGFTSYDQFSEIWGLDKINLELVKSQTYIDTSDIIKININSSDVSVLWNHPYINYKQANSIVNYRAQHGDFYRVQDIQKIVLIDSQLFRKIAPYLKTSD